MASERAPSFFGWAAKTLELTQRRPLKRSLCFSVYAALILWVSAGLKRVRMDERQVYVSNYFREIHIPFGAITDVRQNRWLNSRPITIYFRDATEFGDKATFMPKQRIQFWRIDPVVEELKQLAGLTG
ncbi:MAG: hypothetical protein ACXWKP_11665 [Bradyrhizobium sp.]